MNVQQRNNVTVAGDGPATLVFAHGFGCDQNMWRLLAPHYAAAIAPCCSTWSAAAFPT
jgi:sigma-B regulation protein RsbQ